MAASDRYDRSRDRSIDSIDSIDSIIFRSFEIFRNCSWRRCGSNGPKIVKIRAILAIFWSFEDFCRKIRRPYRRRRKQGGAVPAPPGPSVVGSIGSIIRSVRSIIVQPTSVGRSGKKSFATIIGIIISTKHASTVCMLVRLMQKHHSYACILALAIGLIVQRYNEI